MRIPRAVYVISWLLLIQACNGSDFNLGGCTIQVVPTATPGGPGATGGGTGGGSTGGGGGAGNGIPGGDGCSVDLSSYEDAWLDANAEIEAAEKASDIQNEQAYNNAMAANAIQYGNDPVGLGLADNLAAVLHELNATKISEAASEAELNNADQTRAKELNAINASGCSVDEKNALIAKVYAEYDPLVDSATQAAAADDQYITNTLKPEEKQAEAAFNAAYPAAAATSTPNATAAPAAAESFDNVTDGPNSNDIGTCNPTTNTCGPD